LLAPMLVQTAHECNAVAAATWAAARRAEASRAGARRVRASKMTAR
jgi:hypothetical protein